MPKISHVVDVFVTPEKLFEKITDFENISKILPNIKSVKIISKNDNVVITEDEVLLMGHNSIQQVRHTLEKPNRHIAEILSGDAEGSVIEQIFEKTEDGTSVKIYADFKLKGKLKLIGFMIKNKIKFGLETSIYECADSIDETDS